MIFIQHGPSWDPKMKKILENKFAQGIIWDVREESVERIKEKITEQAKNYNGLISLIDSKLYYAQFATSIPKRLENLEYYPKEIIDRNYLRDTEKIKKNISDLIMFENEFQVSYYTAPTLYIQSFNDRYIDKILDMNDWFDEMTPDNNKFLTLIVHEAAFENDMYMLEFLNDLSNYIGRYKGIYIIIDRDASNSKRNSFSPNRLSNVMNFIYMLKKMQFEVILGYCGIESINYFAVGADAIGTGWFYSLRRFNRTEKGFEDSSRMGHPKKRYTSIKMLSELKIDDNIETILEEDKKILYPIIFNGRETDKPILDNRYDTIPVNADFVQYFDTMNYLSSEFEKYKTIEDKIEYLENIVNNAISNIEIYNSKVKIDQLTVRHLYDYKCAIELFKKQNFI